MTFDWGELVVVSADAPSEYRPGSKAWVVGMSANNESLGRGRLASLSSVYMVEFEDGSSLEVPGTLLQPLPTSR